MPDNPLEVAFDKAANDNADFDPDRDLGVTHENVVEFLETTVESLYKTKMQEHNGVPLVSGEDLRYLTLMGVCIGYELHKGQVKDKFDRIYDDHCETEE